MTILAIDTEHRQRAMTLMLLDALCKDLPSSFGTFGERDHWLAMAREQRRIAADLGLPAVAKNFDKHLARLASIVVCDPAADAAAESGSYDYPGYLQ